MSSSAMATASLMGMAKPRTSTPLELYLAVTTPMTWPRSLNTGPPELPEFTAASSWNMLRVVLRSAAISRSRAEMMPAVMV